MMQPESTDIFTRLESWYSGEKGDYLLTATHAAVRDILDRSFGYHLLQLGFSGARQLGDLSPINHRILCSDRATAATGLVAHADELPLESDSIDAVIAHHCLEFSPHPHQVLREIQRVLRPQGQLLIVGFNPYSAAGVGTRMQQMRRHPLWRQHRPVSAGRLGEWLGVLGCEVQETLWICAIPTPGSGRLHRTLQRCDDWGNRHNVAVGGLYILHATKLVAGLHRPRRVLRVRRERRMALVPSARGVPVTTPQSPAITLEQRDTAA